MPIINPFTGYKRKRPTYRTSFNRRTLAGRYWYDVSQRCPRSDRKNFKVPRGFTQCNVLFLGPFEFPWGSVVMANDLQAVHGSISARRNDLTSVNFSDLNQFLLNLQEGQDTKYCVFGDGIFEPLATPVTTIWSYNVDRPFLPLTDLERHENVVMRKIRIYIEHTYASIDNDFNITTVNGEWKLLSSSNNQAKLRLIFFFANCYTCVHGNTTSKAFKCPPPSLNEFLGV